MNSYLTEALPGIAGEIGPKPSDFCVEEIPLYEPCGTGDHLYLTVEKQGMSTFELLNKVAAAFSVGERDLGYAGLKDARAITRQTISVPNISIKDGLALDIPGVSILSVGFHTNKLRPGHLAGNLFRIRIINTDSDAENRAAAILGVLQDIGVPNRFGRQRYGALGNSHRTGRALLQHDLSKAVEEIIGDPDRIKHEGWKSAARAYRAGDLDQAIAAFPRHCHTEKQLVERLARGDSFETAVYAMPRKLLRLYLSAYQSSLFDRIVQMRLHSIEKLWPGDQAYKHANGASFFVEDPALEQPRADQFEISTSGPLYGFKVRLASGQAGLIEQALLEKEHLKPEAFRLGKGLSMEGARRPLRVPLITPRLEPESNGIKLSFQLPKGSFATAVLHEVMKTGTEDGRLAGGLH